VTQARQELKSRPTLLLNTISTTRKLQPIGELAIEALLMFAAREHFTDCEANIDALHPGMPAQPAPDVGYIPEIAASFIGGGIGKEADVPSHE
jgi:hypothetical protein